MGVLSLRQAGPDDAAELSAVANAVSRELFGEDELAVDEARTWLRQADAHFLVAEVDDRVVGTLNMEPRPDGRVRLDVRVEPDGWNGDVADQLLAAGEKLAPTRFPGSRVARAATYEGLQEQYLRVLEGRGYVRVRSWLQLSREITVDGLPEPALPEGLQFGSFRPADAPRMHVLENEAEAGLWNAEPLSYAAWHAETLGHEGCASDLWVLAWNGDELVACQLGHWLSKTDRHLYMEKLTVHPRWRRQGIGRAVMREALRTCARHGVTRASGQVDTENPMNVLAFYETEGFRVVRRWGLYEKGLESGGPVIS